jgi:hypothetical protein
MDIIFVTFRRCCMRGDMYFGEIRSGFFDILDLIREPEREARGRAVHIGAYCGILWMPPGLESRMREKMGRDKCGIMRR